MARAASRWSKFTRCNDGMPRLIATAIGALAMIIAASGRAETPYGLGARPGIGSYRKSMMPPNSGAYAFSSLLSAAGAFSDLQTLTASQDLPASSTPAPFTSRPLLFPPVATAADIRIGIDETCVSILDGPCTYMWTYGGSYPGLTIRRPTGQTTRVTFANNLPTLAGGKTVHHHGNHSASKDDGQVTGAAFLFDPGQTRTYTYEGAEDGHAQRGKMQWYHDHRMDETGMNVWMGLAGLYIIDDPADPASLPSGKYELPLVIADRSFDADNQLEYFYDPAGVYGDKDLVNGVYQPYLDVADRKYRLRILNGANARTYILTLSTGEPFTQIGTESGLLPAPVSRTALNFGPAERLDLVVDFAGKSGQELYLMDAYEMVPLLKFRVTQHAVDTSEVPTTLRSLPEIGEPTVTRRFSFDFTANHWSINGLGFDPKRVDAHPVLGTTEKWVFTNPTGTTHLVHIHGVDQQCLSRDGKPCYPYEAMKETWSVGPGETLELKMKFTDHTGNFMLHCHILEHEDDGMMTQFQVVPAATPGSSPPVAAPLNLSTRGNIMGGDNNLIVGFIITGSESKRIVLRALGPSLNAAGLSGTLSDPVLRLFNSSNVEIATNDNWQSDPGVGEIQALGLGPNAASEAATIQSLPPGRYTVVVSSKGASTGLALAEVYDLTPNSNSTLANISTRGLVQTGENVMIGGFIVLDQSEKVIVRAIGPSLPVSGALQDPVLELHNENGAVLQMNDNWRSDQEAEIKATTVPPKDDRESAIVRTLTPGKYTAIVRGVKETSGVALVEVFALN